MSADSIVQQNKTVTIPSELVDKIDSVSKARFSKSRADTVRFLILKALADLGYLSDEEKNALFFEGKK